MQKYKDCLLIGLLVALCLGAAVVGELSRVTPLDPTCATKFGVFEPGSDITKPLQWALDHQHEHGRPIVIPAGEWHISETIRTPYRSGCQLLGVGAGLPPKAQGHLVGSRTVLIWAGEPGGTMIRVTGAYQEIGNFTLLGQEPLKANAPRASIGLLVDYDKQSDANPTGDIGLGVGKHQFRRLRGEQLDHVVQVGTTEWTPNCDNLSFDWIEGRACESVYHAVNAMGMDIEIGRLRVYYGAKYGVLADGGGQLHVRGGLVTHGSTLLKVRRVDLISTDKDGKRRNGGPAVGKNNGFFSFANMKLDAQAEDGVMLVDSECPGQVRVLISGGIQASADRYQGQIAQLAPGNFLHLSDFTPGIPAGSITGTADGRSVPAALLTACRVYHDPSKCFGGAVRGRVRDCTDYDGRWIPDFDSEADE